MSIKKKIVQISSSLFPSAFSNFAYKKLTTPQSHKLKQNDIVNLDSSTKSRFNFKSAEIQVYQWIKGDNSPVLLVHGWEGQAGNFSSIISRLLAENLSVVTFDGPSHGLSSKNSGTSLFEFAEVVGVILEKYGVKSVISHSFGGVATMYSLAQNPSLAIDKYILLTTPNKFLDRIETVAEEVGISKRVKERLINRLEIELKMDLSKISVADLSRNVNVKSALILHDELDKVISINESKAVNDVWSICNLEIIHDTGHFKILNAELVHNRIISFLQA